MSFGLGMNFGLGGLMLSSIVVDGEIVGPFVIGDDYLAANGRSFEWIVPKVTGFVDVDCTCAFGVQSINGFDRFTVTGTLTEYDDNNWKISFDVAKVETSGFKPGPYNWSASVTHAGVEITKVRPLNTVLQMVRKFA